MPVSSTPFSASIGIRPDNAGTAEKRTEVKVKSNILEREKIFQGTYAAQPRIIYKLPCHTVQGVKLKMGVSVRLTLS